MTNPSGTGENDPVRHLQLRIQKETADMKIEAYIQEYLKGRLEADNVLVIYESEQLYRRTVRAMANDRVTVVDGTASTILGREAAMEAWCRMGQAEGEDLRLVVYLPLARPAILEERQINPYQIFVLGGGDFPAGDGEPKPAQMDLSTAWLKPSSSKTGRDHLGVQGPCINIYVKRGR